MVQNLGLSNKEKTRLEMIQDLNSYLIQQLRTGRTVALLIDEAQKLGSDVSPIDGAAILALLARTAATPKDVIARYVAIGAPERK